MLKMLKEKDKGKIILINVGAFYIAIEEDAVLLREKLGLKCTCFTKHACKVGIPINSIEKYKEELDNLRYSYIIYNYNREKNEIKKLYSKVGKLNKIKEKNIDCNICKGINTLKNDIYMQAFNSYIKNEKEIKENIINEIKKIEN